MLGWFEWFTRLLPHRLSLSHTHTRIHTSVLAVAYNIQFTVISVFSLLVSFTIPNLTNCFKL
jgi:hypothetical protein